MSFITNYDNLYKAIIRPPRSQYNDFDLGPNIEFFEKYQSKRHDFTLKNSREMNIKCSFYEPIEINQWKNESGNANKQSRQFPCIIYAHCNSGSRIEAMCNLSSIISKGIGYFTFDFSGSGLSEGEFVTLGWHEWQDLQAVIKYLKKSQKVSKIGLWGRSMGAVTSLLYAWYEPKMVQCMVIDSAFSNLKGLALEQAQQQSSLVPNFIFEYVLGNIRDKVKSMANFDINDLDLRTKVKDIDIPSLFVCSKQDTLVGFHHTEKLFQNYKGQKNILLVTGEHNQSRDNNFKQQVIDFFIKNLLETNPGQSANLNCNNSSCSTFQTKLVLSENESISSTKDSSLINTAKGLQEVVIPSEKNNTEKNQEEKNLNQAEKNLNQAEKNLKFAEKFEQNSNQNSKKETFRNSANLSERQNLNNSPQISKRLGRNQMPIQEKKRYQNEITQLKESSFNRSGENIPKTSNYSTNIQLNLQDSILSPSSPVRDEKHLESPHQLKNHMMKNNQQKLGRETYKASMINILPQQLQNQSIDFSAQNLFVKQAQEKGITSVSLNNPLKGSIQLSSEGNFRQQTYGDYFDQNQTSLQCKEDNFLGGIKKGYFSTQVQEEKDQIERDQAWQDNQKQVQGQFCFGGVVGQGKAILNYPQQVKSRENSLIQFNTHQTQRDFQVNYQQEYLQNNYLQQSPNSFRQTQPQQIQISQQQQQRQTQNQNSQNQNSQNQNSQNQNSQNQNMVNQKKHLIQEIRPIKLISFEEQSKDQQVYQQQVPRGGAAQTSQSQNNSNANNYFTNISYMTQYQVEQSPQDFGGGGSQGPNFSSDNSPFNFEYQQQNWNNQNFLAQENKKQNLSQERIILKEGVQYNKGDDTIQQEYVVFDQLKVQNQLQQRKNSNQQIEFNSFNKNVNEIEQNQQQNQNGERSPSCYTNLNQFFNSANEERSASFLDQKNNLNKKKEKSKDTLYSQAQEGYKNVITTQQKKQEIDEVKENESTQNKFSKLKATQNKQFSLENYQTHENQLQSQQENKFYSFVNSSLQNNSFNGALKQNQPQNTIQAQTVKTIQISLGDNHKKNSPNPYGNKLASNKSDGMLQANHYKKKEQHFINKISNQQITYQPNIKFSNEKSNNPKKETNSNKNFQFGLPGNYQNQIFNNITSPSSNNIVYYNNNNSFQKKINTINKRNPQLSNNPSLNHAPFNNHNIHQNKNFQNQDKSMNLSQSIENIYEISSQMFKSDGVMNQNFPLNYVSNKQ